VLYDRLGDREGVSKRSVFVLDKNGIVRYKCVTEDPKVPPDAKAVAAAVAKLG
jgi:peroxiredoxin